MSVLSPNSYNFRSFGKIIEYPNKHRKGNVRNLWRIVHTEKENVGWRVAYLILRDKMIGRLECHPFSDETFEPIRGRALMFISKNKDLSHVKCFKIDKPFIVYKGVWHGLVTLSPETEIKITENAKVICRYLKLKRRISTLRELSLL